MSDELDMSVLCDNWTPSRRHPEALALMPRNRDLTLSLNADKIVLTNHPILLLQAEAGGEEIWGLRVLPIGELLFSADRGQWDSKGRVFTERLSLALSFSPSQGGLSIVVSNPPAVAVTFTANVGPIRDYYNLRIGCQVGTDDACPFGWRISSRFDLAEPIVDGEPAEDWRLREGPLPASPALVEASPPDETLALALQSIEHWLKVAQSALEQKEQP